MKWMKAAGAAILAALAIYGGIGLSRSAGNLYDDWVFLRSARVQAIQRQQQQAAQQAAQQQRQAAPAAPAPAAVAPPQ